VLLLKLAGPDRVVLRVPNTQPSRHCKHRAQLKEIAKPNRLMTAADWMLLSDHRWFRAQHGP